jgi:hypothetical protein
MAGASTVTCPAGHASTTTDYCDTCGAPIGAKTKAQEEAEAEVEAVAAAAGEPGAAGATGEGGAGVEASAAGAGRPHLRGRLDLPDRAARARHAPAGPHSRRDAHAHPHPDAVEP